MKIRKYTIDIFKLSNTQHDYEFEFDNDFFTLFEESLVNKGKGDIKLILDKSESMVKLKFNIEGKVELICDRSLDSFDYALDIKQGLIMKFGEDYEELSEEMVVIPKSTQQINIAQYVYEFIGLAIPMKKLHPRYKDESEEDEEGSLIYSSEDNKNNSEGSVDPRWNKLKKLK